MSQPSGDINQILKNNNDTFICCLTRVNGGRGLGSKGPISNKEI